MRLIVVEQPEVLQGAYQPQEFDLDFDQNTALLRVGRQLTNDITLLDISVSRQHAELIPRAGGVLVHDLASSNGTFVNDSLVPSKGQVMLYPGDLLRLGMAVLRLETTEQIAMANDVDNYGFMKMAEQPVLPQENAANPFIAIPPPLKDAQSYIHRDASDLPSPAQLERILQERRKSPTKPRRGKGLWLITLLVILLLAASAALIVASFLVFNFGGSSATPTAVSLSSGSFNETINSEAVFGLNVVKPESWKRTDVDASKVVFTLPEGGTAAFTIEKPPSSSVAQANSSPEEAIRQYAVNVKRVGQNVRVLVNPALTTLKNGVKGFVTSVVFSTNTAPLVKDYVVQAFSFNCSDGLYFVTIGDEDASFRNGRKQNLEAALANVGCK